MYLYPLLTVREKNMLLERIRFMKVNKHKTFNFTPRYYDERKDRIQKIKDSYSDDVQKPTEQQEILRDKLQFAWRKEKGNSRQSKLANLRLIIILMALLFVAYYILGYVDIFTAEVINLEN